MKKQLKISLCANIVTFYVTGLSNIWAHEQAVKNKNTLPLQDQGFKLIPYDDTFLFYNDYILYIVLGITFVFICFQNNKKEIILRWSLMLNLLFSLRIIMIPSTILTIPVNPGEEWSSCNTLEHDYNGFFGPIEMIFNNKYTCFDFIFSGHMVNITICILLLIKYINHKYGNLLWVFCVLEAYVIILIRSHYLIDIEVAFVLTILIWTILEYREIIHKQDDQYINPV